MRCHGFTKGGKKCRTKTSDLLCWNHSNQPINRIYKIETTWLGHFALIEYLNSRRKTAAALPPNWIFINPENYE